MCLDDITRVHLNEGPDYINANNVDIEIYTTGQINGYVAAQGPMQHTCKDFWQVLMNLSHTHARTHTHTTHTHTHTRMHMHTHTTHTHTRMHIHAHTTHTHYTHTHTHTHTQMVWEQNTTLVVMLTEVIEEGKVRCCKYWPDPRSKQEYGKYEVTNLSEQIDRVYVTRQLKLKNRMVGT